MTTGLIIVGVLIVLFAAYLGFSISKYKHALKNFDQKNQSQHLIKLNDKNFNTIISHGITLVDFWAAWCKPCVFLAPIINELADAYAGSDKIKIAKMDVEANRKIPGKLGIMNIPTVIIFKDGKEIQRIVGVKPFNYYKKILDKLA